MVLISFVRFGSAWDTGRGWWGGEAKTQDTWPPVGGHQDTVRDRR